MFGFSPSKEQKMVKDTYAEIVRDIVSPESHDMDEDGKIPDKYLQQTWDLGGCVSAVPEEWGGDGMDASPVMNALILEELAAGDMAFAVAAMAPSLFITPLLEMGTDKQKAAYLPDYCTEKFVPSTLALCEPQMKFDAAAPVTSAEKKNGAFILNGSKCFVPLLSKSSHVLVSAALDGRPQLFLVNTKNPGVAISEKEKNLGLYALETNALTLTDCEVSADDLLGGEEGCDFNRLLQKTRVGMAAMATGMCRASFEFVRKYAKERIQFGEPIAHRQSVAFMIAEMAYETDAMRLLTWKAASMLEAGKDAQREAYLAQLYCGEMAMKICDYGVQVMGGHGYIRDYPVERYYRNARGAAILEGMAIV